MKDSSKSLVYLSNIKNILPLRPNFLLHYRLRKMLKNLSPKYRKLSSPRTAKCLPSFALWPDTLVVTNLRTMPVRNELVKPPCSPKT